MAVVIALSSISFIFEGIISNYLNYTITNPTILKTMYTLITLVILSKYFDNKKKYFLIVFIFGLLYDITYTNTFIFNVILFLSITFITTLIKNIFSDTVISENIINLLAVVLYHLFSFAILQIIGYNIYDFKLLLLIITHSIIMTLIYSTIIYYLSNYLFIKFDVKQIR
jgi:cell shape-determining protein MreD